MYDCHEKAHQAIRFNNHELLITGSGALIWPVKKLLAIADLHLEKGSYFAAKGNPLPLYDTTDTLLRIKQLIERYEPETVISLGDNIHDIKALDRMSTADLAMLYTLVGSVKEWLWLAGNHDKAVLPKPCPNLYFHESFAMNDIIFSHDCQTGIPFQIVGHYHPKAKVRNISGKCFLTSPNKIFMPSFGSYTGGLDIDNLAFKKVCGDEKFKTFLLYREKIWQIR